jgi:hypothetical protein
LHGWLPTSWISNAPELLLSKSSVYFSSCFSTFSNSAVLGKMLLFSQLVLLLSIFSIFSGLPYPLSQTRLAIQIMVAVLQLDKSLWA